MKRFTAALIGSVIVASSGFVACGDDGRDTTSTPTDRPTLAGTSTTIATSTPSLSPQPGATYMGTTSQQTTIKFVLSDDGSGIVRYRFVVNLRCEADPFVRDREPGSDAPVTLGDVAAASEFRLSGRTLEGHRLLEQMSRQPDDGAFRYEYSLDGVRDVIAEIVGGEFAIEETGLWLAGTFLSSTEAEGILRLKLTEWPCDSGDMSWRASSRD